MTKAKDIFGAKYPTITDTILKGCIAAINKGVANAEERAEYSLEETDRVNSPDGYALVEFFRRAVDSIVAPLNGHLKQHYEGAEVGIRVGFKPESYCGFNSSSTLGGGSGYTATAMVTIRMAWSHPKGKPEPERGHNLGQSRYVRPEGHFGWRVEYYNVWVPLDSEAAARSRRAWVSSIS